LAARKDHRPHHQGTLVSGRRFLPWPQILAHIRAGRAHNVSLTGPMLTDDNRPAWKATMGRIRFSDDEVTTTPSHCRQAGSSLQRSGFFSTGAKFPPYPSCFARMPVAGAVSRLSGGKAVCSLRLCRWSPEMFCLWPSGASTVKAPLCCTGARKTERKRTVQGQLTENRRFCPGAPVERRRMTCPCFMPALAAGATVTRRAK